MSAWIVPGDATDIGCATALRLAAPNAAFAVVYSGDADVDPDTVVECARRRARAIAIAAAVSTDADDRAVVATVRGACGDRLHGLVDDAGTMRFAPAGDLDLDAVNADDFHDLDAVNGVGDWRMTRAFAAWRVARRPPVACG